MLASFFFFFLISVMAPSSRMITVIMTIYWILHVPAICPL